MHYASVYKRLIGRLHEEELGLLAVENPLAADSVAGLLCPNCGEMAANVQKVEDAEVELSGEEPEVFSVAVCGCCGAEFVPQEPPAAQGIVSAVLGERARLLRRVAQAPLQESASIVYNLSR